MTKTEQQFDFSYLRGQREPQSVLIAVGGGKGGVGKSFVSSSLALLLAHRGFDTVLVDLDLGSANLHTYLGQGPTQKGINEYLLQPELKFQDVISPTPFPHLRFVSGASEQLNVSTLQEGQKGRLMSALYNTPADFIVLDLSAGAHDTTLDFFLMASRQVIVMTPEPSSMENAYGFMKAAFYRKLKRHEKQLRLGGLLGQLMAKRQELGIRTPADLLQMVLLKEPERGLQLKKVMRDLSFEIVLNQARSQNDANLGPSIKTVCNKYFGVSANLLGSLDYDNAVWQALRKRRPVLLEYPHSRLYTQLTTISRQFANVPFKRAVV